MGVVLTTVAATLCMQLGYFLWKLSAVHQPKIGAAPARQVVRALVTDWRWMSGTAGSVLGWLLFIRATSIGEISVIQPLMSTGDLLLVVMAVVFLKERLGRREVLGLVVTIAGAMGLAWGAREVPGGEWHWGPLGGLLLCTVGGATLMVLYARRREAKEVPLALAVGLLFGTGAVMTEAWTAAAQPGWRAALHPLLAGLMAANVMGLVLIQAAFQRGRAAVIVPVHLAVGNAVALAGGAWLFHEPLSIDRVSSVLIIAVGAALLQGRAAQLEPTPPGHEAPP